MSGRFLSTYMSQRKGKVILNIQIFGKSKCFDTKKAERWFKERKISYQRVELPEKGFSKGEYNSVLQALGGDWKSLVDPSGKEYERQYMAYLRPEDAQAKLLEFPALFQTPIVRNGKQATVGYHPEIWENWE